MLRVLRDRVIEELDDGCVTVEHQRPIERFSRRIGNADSLGSQFGSANLRVKPALGVESRIVDQAGLERYRHKLRVDLANDLGIGEHRLTGGAGEHSTTGIINGPVDEYPKEKRLF